MDFESLVLHYLAAKGFFLSPQFSIYAQNGTVWRCPDFVGLDFANKQVNIIELCSFPSSSSHRYTQVVAGAAEPRRGSSY
ncbi:MAG: hypothetical protein NTX45_01650 [Proteobacteria bacterium]|nr:hypothetical protein [Pseudomonadota bacterium]